MKDDRSISVNKPPTPQPTPPPPAPAPEQPPAPAPVSIALSESPIGRILRPKQSSRIWGVLPRYITTSLQAVLLPVMIERKWVPLFNANLVLT